MDAQIIVQLLVDIVRILVAIILSAAALYSGMRLVDRMTPEIDEWKEIKKGNLAIGLLFAAVMAAIMLVVGTRIEEVVFSLRLDLPLVTAIELILLSFVNYLVGLLAATLIIYLTLHLIDRLTPDLDEMAELRKGNLAVALVYSFALLLVTVALSIPLQDAFGLLMQAESLLL